MMTDWVSRYKREHPFLFWWYRFRLKLELRWDWILNRPVWDFSQGQPRAIYARTGQELSEEEMFRHNMIAEIEG